MVSAADHQCNCSTLGHNTSSHQLLTQLGISSLEANYTSREYTSSDEYTDRDERIRPLLALKELLCICVGGTHLPDSSAEAT